ncbi:MAG: hypothetical protein GTN81_06705 [Proteobacteria bacterium]|nr:hypothetical protein [Pseudomonadota bacterium]
MGQSLSPPVDQEGGDDAPFVDCLLGALGNIDAPGEEETAPEAQNPVLLSPVVEGIGLESNRALLGLLPRQGPVSEKPVLEVPLNRVKTAEEMLPKELGEATKTETVVKITENKSSVLPQEGGGTLPGKMSQESPSLHHIVRIHEEAPSASSEPHLARGQESLPAKVLMESDPARPREVTEEVLGQTFQGLVRGNAAGKAKPPVAANGKNMILTAPSEHGIKEEGGVDRPTVQAKEEFSLPDPLTSDNSRTKAINLPIEEEAKNGLPKAPSFAETSQKRGIQEPLPAYKEGPNSLTAQPLASEQIAVRASRPLPLSLADGVMQQILENLNVRTWRVGQKNFKIQLHPEEMGRLRLEIGMREHQVVLKINVENPLVKDLIENNLAQLRENLLDRGLRMDKCLVTVNDHFQPQSGGGQDNSTTSANHPFPIDQGEIDETASQRLSSPDYWDTGLVNLFI